MYCANPECPDFVSSGIRGEYVDWVTVCPVCGATLVERNPDDDRTADGGQALDLDAALSQEPEVVYSGTDPSAIPVVKSILDGAGIPYVVRGEELLDALIGGRSPQRYNPLGGKIELLVPGHLATEARFLLTEVEE